jgi:hypothetical protein
MEKFFIISDDTRIEQERLFLQIVNELTINKENIDYFKVISSDYFVEKILFSKIIVLPLTNKDYIFGNLTRISDSLAL